MWKSHSHTTFENDFERRERQRDIPVAARALCLVRDQALRQCRGLHDFCIKCVFGHSRERKGAKSGLGQLQQQWTDPQFSGIVVERLTFRLTTTNLWSVLGSIAGRGAGETMPGH